VTQSSVVLSGAEMRPPAAKKLPKQTSALGH
jgi:hypothetical protein